MKRITILFIAFLLGLTYILIAVPVNAQINISLAPPENVTARAEGTEFIIEWKNPKSIEEFATPSYDEYYRNLNGTVFYGIDWRINGGEWHLSEEAPLSGYIFDSYRHINGRFFGNVYVNDYESYFASKVEISKLMFGLPYSESITEWLKTNNIEFRVRYYCEYWDDMDKANINLYSPFSNAVFMGALNPTGTGAQMPMNEFGMPQYLSKSDAPENLAVTYMTLNLRWKVNNGEWHDILKEAKLDAEKSYRFGTLFQETDMDKDGYATFTIARSALGIRESVESWLSRNTCYFKARYVILDGEGKEIVSAYSNTAVTGKGTPAPSVPKLEKPLQLGAKLTSKWEKHIIDFTWIASPSISEINKTAPVMAYVDYKPQGGKWQTELKGMRGTDGYRDDLDEKYSMYFDQDKVQGVYSFRIYFACQYAPNKWAFSGFSNVLTVDFGSGKVANPKKL